MVRNSVDRSVANTRMLPMQRTRTRSLSLSAALLVAWFCAGPWGGTLGAAPAEAVPRFRISLLTIDPGPEIYSAWGHTALRVDDARTGQQFVFDYGLFRFDSAFLFRFLKGDPIYQLGVTTWALTERRYRSAGRRIRAQGIELPPQEAETFVRALATNALPQNRNYVYNHFTNNCTTVYRDHLDRLLGGAFGSSFRSRPSGRTLRDTTTAPLRDKPFVRLGSHLILNGNTDLPATAWQEMFLPSALLIHLDTARISGTAIQERIGPIQTLLDPPRQTALLRPFLGWSLCALLCVCFAAGIFVRPVAWRRRASRAAFWLWAVLAGLLGMGLFLLNYFSAFEIFHHNLNLFAFHPLIFVWPLLDRVVGRTLGARAAVALSAAFVAWPVLGLLIALTDYSIQYSEPFLLTALLAHALILLDRWRARDESMVQPERQARSR